MDPSVLPPDDQGTIDAMARVGRTLHDQLHQTVEAWVDVHEPFIRSLPDEMAPEMMNFALATFGGCMAAWVSQLSSDPVDAMKNFVEILMRQADLLYQSQDRSSRDIR